MALPKHRSTSSRRKKRASHFSLKKRQLTTCRKCKEAVMPHCVCPSCGIYAGRKVMTLKDPLAKKGKKKSAGK